MKNSLQEGIISAIQNWFATLTSRFIIAILIVPLILISLHSAAIFSLV